MAAKPPCDPVADFTPVSLLAIVTDVLMVNPKFGVRNLKDLVAFQRAEPDEHSYASSGNGTPMQLSGELFKTMAGVQVRHLPDRGGGLAMNDLVAGHVNIVFDVLSGSAEFIRSGAVGATAVTTRTRVRVLPDIPTLDERGLVGYETYTWNGVFGPAGLPRSIVGPLDAALLKAIGEADVKKRRTDLSAVVVGTPPEGSTVQVKSELAKWEPVIKAAGLKQQPQ